MKLRFETRYEPKTLPPECKAFLEAAQRGDLAGVQHGLSSGVPVDVVGYLDIPWNQTALMYAARNGHLEVIRALSQTGANIAAVDTNASESEGNQQALHHAVKGGAVMGGHLPVIEELLAAGADPNALTSFGNPPLNLAILNDNRAAAELLMARGANIRLKAGRARVTPPLVAAVDSKLSPATASGWVSYLLAAGADPNAAGRRGVAPLRRVTMGHDIENDDRLAIMEVLLQAGAAVDQTDDEGDTALLTAVLFNNARAARILTSAGAKVDCEIPRGTLLDIADVNLEHAQREASQPTENQKLRDIWQHKLDSAMEMVAMLVANGVKRKAEKS